MIIFGGGRAERAAGDHVLWLSFILHRLETSAFSALSQLWLSGNSERRSVGVCLNEPNPARLIVAERLLMQRE